MVLNGEPEAPVALYPQGRNPGAHWMGGGGVGGLITVHFCHNCEGRLW
jgi:hypothetical protein